MATVDMIGSAEPGPGHRTRFAGSPYLLIALAVAVTFGIGVVAGHWFHNGSRLVYQCAGKPTRTITFHPGTTATLTCRH